MVDIGWADTFITIFIGMGPIKVLLVYLAVTRDAGRDLQRRVARKTVTTATAVGLILLVAGVLFMKILHFTTSALTVAGGLILLLLALHMVMSKPADKEQGASPSEAALMGMAIYPMGVPLLLNPIGIVSLTVFSAETEKLVQLGIIAAMVLAVAALDFAIFLFSYRLDNVLTKERIIVAEKLLGILLAALAVQMMLDGLAELGVITLNGGHG